MARKKKTWTEKLNIEATFEVTKTEKKFADMPEGCIMLIASPPIINDYVNSIPAGSQSDLKTMRKDLAVEYNAEMTCPVTTGIFLRIVAEAAYEQYQQGKKLSEITPFWRVVAPNMPVAKKLACGIDFIREQREKEGLAA